MKNFINAHKIKRTNAGDVIDCERTKEMNKPQNNMVKSKITFGFALFLSLFWRGKTKKERELNFISLLLLVRPIQFGMSYAHCAGHVSFTMYLTLVFLSCGFCLDMIGYCCWCLVQSATLAYTHSAIATIHLAVWTHYQRQAAATTTASTHIIGSTKSFSHSLSSSYSSCSFIAAPEFESNGKNSEMK